MISPKEYCSLASSVDGSSFDNQAGYGYSALPAALLEAEQSVARVDPHAVLELNKALCRTLVERFSLDAAAWNWPEQFHGLYGQQLKRIEGQLIQEPDSYFAFSNDPFRKDLAILLHRLIPCGAEFAFPFSGVPRSLLIKGGLIQAGRFIKAIAFCRGLKPFIELHMHPKYVAEFNPEGWLRTYDNLADFLEMNPSMRGVQSTSWFLDPVLEKVSPHLAYLRQVPERCGATFLYAGYDDRKYSGAFATSQTRRTLHAEGNYSPRLFTRIWPRQNLLQRSWQTAC